MAQGDIDRHGAGGAGGTGSENPAEACEPQDQLEDELPGEPAAPAPLGQRRSAGRIRLTGVSVHKGVVLDASAGGLRVKGKLRKGCVPGDHIDLEVRGDDEAVSVRCEVRWIQRHPLRGATFGVSFVDLSDDLRRELFAVIRRAGTEARCRWMAA